MRVKSRITGSRYGRVLFDPPVDLLARVLQHVEQSQRLRSCALVSTKWRHAANLATRSASVTADTQQRFDSLSAWLNSDRNACSKLQCIQAAYKSAADGFGRHRPVLNVPFAALQQLRSLQLLQCRVKAVGPATSDNTNPAGTATAGGAASAAPSAVQEPQCLRALTALSRLELVESSMQLSGLGYCTGLQHLKLYNCGGDNLLLPLQSALPQLQQLTHIDVWMKGNKPHERQKELMSGIFAAISRMQQIKVLHLSASYKRFKAADMTHIPTCLSALHLIDAPALDPSTMSQLQEMTQLQCLHLVRPRQFNPAILSGLTQLTSLSVTECHIEDAGTVNGLLRAVQQMQQLKHLDLNNSLLEDSSEPELYAAFTGSSQLISLDISKNRILPDAYKYMFPADASLTALTSLATCSDMLDNDRVCERLVACCPALNQLIVMDEVGSASNYPKDILALTELSGLTTIIMHDVETDDGVLRSISRCTQLKELKLDIPDLAFEQPSLWGLQDLTRLTGLTQLHVSARLPSDWFVEDLVKSDGAPDVYLQLEQAVAKYKEEHDDDDDSDESEGEGSPPWRKYEYWDSYCW